MSTAIFCSEYLHSGLRMCKLNMSQADACEECANKCSLIHKKNRDPSSIVSSCFKVMISDRFFKFLPLPPRFAPRLASLVDQETRVEDSSGRKWTLTLSTYEGRLGFGKGWDDFSSDHGIEFGDIVIVHYILDSHFAVQIYGRSGCEKLTLPSQNNTIPNKRARTAADSAARDGPSNKRHKDSSTSYHSGQCLAAVPSNKECLEEPCLMMVNRDTPMVGEEERITLFDEFASEVSNIKSVGEVDNVQKGNGSSNAKDIDKGKYGVNLKIENGDKSNRKFMQSGSATKLEIPEQLHNDDGFSNYNDMLLDYVPTFEDFLGDPLDVKMSEINEKGIYEFQWTSEIDYESNLVTKEEIGISTINSTELRCGHVREISGRLPVSTDLPLSASKETHIPAQPRAQITTSVRHIDGNKGKSIWKEPAFAIGGSRSMNIRSDIPVKGSIGQSAKTVKIEPKEFKKEQVGNCYRDTRRSEPNTTEALPKKLNAAACAGEVRKIVKAEPVDYTPLEVACFVTPNSESFLEIPKGLPTMRARVEVKVVVLRDSGGRRWPVLYHDKYVLKGLGCGWGSFSRANGIQSGDECVFTLEDQFESLYRVQVIPKQAIPARIG